MRGIEGFLFVYIDNCGPLSFVSSIYGIKKVDVIQHRVHLLSSKWGMYFSQPFIEQHYIQSM